MTNRFYAIQIKPQFREKADIHLTEQNFAPFFPSIQIRITKTRFVIEPLFKGYGFVKFDIERDQWLAINSTVGVIRLLPQHKLIPEPMPYGFVEHLQQEDPIEEDKFIDSFDEFYPNLVVQIRKGAAEGRKAVVRQVRAKLVEISFLSDLGAKSAIWIAKRDAVPIEAPNEE